MTKYVRKRNEIAVEDFIEGIVKGDRVILAQAITLVESNAKRHFEKAQQLIEALLQSKAHPYELGLQEFLALEKVRSLTHSERIYVQWDTVLLC
jgi:hypothetical protein